MTNSDNKKRRIILHIGMQKTGSSTIQRHFRSRHEMLGKAGILYPVVSKNVAHSFLRNQFLQNKRRFRKSLNSIHEEANTNHIDNIVISTEDFSILNRARVKTLAKIFLKLFQDFHFTVVVYLRRQDKWIESLYRQVVKGKKLYINEIEKFQIRPRTRALMDYYAVLAPWAEAFGKDNVIVRTYERTRLEGGLLLDFVDAASLPLPESSCSSEVWINKSFSRDDTVLLKYFNKKNLDEQTNELIRKALWSITANESGSSETFFMNPNQRKELLEEYRRSNADVAREYLGRDDGRLFLEPEPEPDDPWTPPLKPSVEEAEALLRKLVDGANKKRI